MAGAGNPYILPGPTGAGTPQPGPTGATGLIGATGGTGLWTQGANGLANALSGAPGLSYGPDGPQYPANGPPGVSPGQAQATIDPNILNSMQGYTDAAYHQATRTLDPQWQQRQADFAQQMVGQGLQPGSAAYDSAMRNFSMSQNDAYDQARTTAMQTGLGAQGQAFGEGFQNASLANAADIAAMNNAAQRSVASIGANASMSNNSANNATNQLLGLGNLGLGYQGQQMQQGQNDFENMLAAFGYGRQGDIYNNSQTQGAAQNLLGMIPNGGATPIDVTGPYGMQAQGQQSQYQQQAGQASATNAAETQAAQAALMAAMMFMSSRELKDDKGPIDPETTLAAVKSLPLHEWNYKGDASNHIGTFSEDFNEKLGLPKSKGIHFIDMFGALIGSVQALVTRIEALERKLP